MPKFIAGTLSSLERRLIGALLIIVACIAALQIVSQFRGQEMVERSEALAVQAGNAQLAEQLEDLVTEFRIAANLHILDQRKPIVTGTDDLVDIAVRIGDQINALRLAGMPLYQIKGGTAAFDDLYRHIDDIAAIASDGGASDAQFAAVSQRNEQLTDLAAQIVKISEGIEARNLAQMQKAAHDWNMFVVLTGVSSLLIILLILCDLLQNILPALRRLHATLKDLAAGKLDVEIENFRLRELAALAGPLETFRQNALAVKNLAFTDMTSGLPNRRAIIEAVAERLPLLLYPHNERMALVVADIDRFKHINDDFGHAAGDHLVMEVGQRMQAIAGPDALVARVGGDEFAVFLPLTASQSAERTTGDLVCAMREPFMMGGYSVAITMSAGVIELGKHNAREDVNLLLDRADMALYAAKNGGRNRAVAFVPALEADRTLDRALENDLSRAVFQQQLRMVYQPILAVDDSAMEVEALVRWKHPEQGEISPARFIPAAERSGQMVELGAWIIERSIADMSRWTDISLSLNLSPIQLQQDGFCAFLLSVCRKNQIEPDRLILEVTESLSIERNTRALITLELLRNSGFRIALDDFGTGYSSLSMLKTFRFDRLKLDRSLIADLADDPTSQAVFDAAVTMALRVGAQVVAEGISEYDLIEPVSLSGCTHLQGFHFSRPIEASEVEAFFRSREDIASPAPMRFAGSGMRANAG